MVSIKEVAKHAGVAISTVSKVLNGYPNVSEETKKRVQDAIKELNYIPNSIAAALSSKQFGRIALVLDPNRQTQAIDQIFMQYLVGALDKAKETECGSRDDLSFYDRGNDSGRDHQIFSVTKYLGRCDLWHVQRR